MIGTYKRRLLFAFLFVVAGILLWIYGKWLWKVMVMADHDDTEPTVTPTATPYVTVTVTETSKTPKPETPNPTDTAGLTPSVPVEPTSSTTESDGKTPVEPTPKPTDTNPVQTPKPSVSVKPTATATVKPTATPTVKPTATPKPTPTQTPTPKPTNTPKPTPTPTPTLPPDILPDIGEEIKNDKGKVIAVGIDPDNDLGMPVPTEVNPEWNSQNAEIVTETYNGVNLTRIGFGIHDYVFYAGWDGSRFTIWFFGVDFVFPLHMKPNEVTMHWLNDGEKLNFEEFEKSYYWFEDFTISVNGKVVYYNPMLKTPYEGGFAIG